MLVFIQGLVVRGQENLGVGSWVVVMSGFDQWVSVGTNLNDIVL